MSEEKDSYIRRTNMDFIELLVYTDNSLGTTEDNDGYSLALVKASTINLVEARTHEYSYVHTTQGKVFKTVGNYRTVTNRLFYANQNHKIINMSILKPSDFFYHRIDEIFNYVDNIYFSQDFMEKLKKVIESPLFTYRGIMTFDSE